MHVSFAFVVQFYSYISVDFEVLRSFRVATFIFRQPLAHALVRALYHSLFNTRVCVPKCACVHVCVCVLALEALADYVILLDIQLLNFSALTCLLNNAPMCCVAGLHSCKNVFSFRQAKD